MEGGLRRKFTFNEDGTVASTNIREDGSFRWSWEDEVSGKRRYGNMALFPFVPIYIAIQTPSPFTGGGGVSTYEIMETGLLLAGHTPTKDDERRLRSAVIALEMATYQWRTLTDFLVEYSYIMLKNRKLNYATAADYASMMLGRKIKPDAWRMRVTKWADLAGLPKIEQRKRRPPSVANEKL